MRFLLFSLLVFWSSCVVAQDTLRVSRDQAEAMFLENNLALIAQKLKIEKEKAEVMQAKLWPNPTLSIGDVNAWATKRHTDGEVTSPPFWGVFGDNQQISIEIEQLIRTSGSRRNQIKLEELDVSRAEEEFRHILRTLKSKLRKHLTDLQFIQQSKQVYTTLLESLASLTKARNNQFVEGHISQQEFVRLQALEMKIQHEALRIEEKKSAIQTEIKFMLGIPIGVDLQIDEADFVPKLSVYSSFSVEQLLEVARDKRPDYLMAKLAQKQRKKLLKYERSKRIPDLNLHMNYDRLGGIMLDFIGFGLSFDLPVFDRNQGNIQKAHVQIKQASTETQELILNIEHEVYENFSNLRRQIVFAQQIDADFEKRLDRMLERHISNYHKRRINLLTLIDFLQTYLDNKNRILETTRKIRYQIEDLHVAIGSDISTT